MSRSLLLAATFSFSPLLGAQSTWVVDAAGGPGVHFTTIQEAVDAAADGDLVVVRGATSHYTPPIVMKGLRIVGVAKAGVVPTLGQGSFGLIVHYLQPNQTAVIANFQVTPGARVSLTGCAAPVHIEAVGRLGAGAAATISQCPGVTIRNCVFEGQSGAALVVYASGIVCTQSTLHGLDGISSSSGTVQASSGLLALQASVALADCVLIGGRGIGVNPMPALTLNTADAAVDGASSLFGGGTVAVEGQGNGTSNLTLDPGARLTGTLLGSLATRTARVPTTGLRIGGTSLGFDVRGAAAGGPVAFLLGVPSLPIQLSVGTLWLEPASLFEVAVVGADGRGKASLDFGMPNLPAAFGYRFGMQAAVVDPIAATIELTSPSAAIVR